MIAGSDNTIVVECNHHFPVEPVDAALVAAGDTTIVRRWKDTASYYSTRLGDAESRAAARSTDRLVRIVARYSQPPTRGARPAVIRSMQMLSQRAPAWTLASPFLGRTDSEFGAITSDTS